MKSASQVREAVDESARRQVVVELQTAADNAYREAHAIGERAKKADPEFLEMLREQAAACERRGHYYTKAAEGLAPFVARAA